MTLSICCDVSPAFAQRASVGIEGGIPSSWLDVSAVFGTHPKAGAMAGGFVTFPLSSTVRFQPEILIGKRRFTAESGGTADVSSTSIEVPLLVRAAVAKTSRTALVLLAVRS